MKTVTADKQHEKMLNTPIPKLVLSLSVPTVIGMLITVIYNTADTYFVSQINKSASAAVGVVYTVMAIIQAIGYGFGMGCGSLISRMLGKKADDAAHKFAASALYGSVLAGAVISVLGLCFLEPFMELLGCTETMLPYAKDYAFYILIGAPVTCASFVLNNILRCQGQSRLAMIGTVTGGVLNMGLDPLFIFTFNMGTGGAALATIISQAVTFIILLMYFVFKKSIVSISPKYISRHPKDYALILATGAPTVCRQGLGSLAAALLNLNAVVYGDAAVAAVTIANKVYVLVRNIVIGVGQGFQPVAGYNFGAGDKKRTKSAFRFACTLGSAVCVISAAAIAALARPIMMWFCHDSAVADIGRQTLLYCCAVMPFMAVSTYVNQLYQCLGYKIPATFLASCRQGVFFIPAILLLPLIFGITGVEIAQPAADLCTFIISIPFLIVFMRKVLNKE